MSKDKRGTLLILTLLVSTLLLGGVTQALARDRDGNRNGFRDGRGHYHQYGYHNHHRGYWNQHDNGVRFWINL